MKSLSIAFVLMASLMMANIHCVPVENVTNEPEQQQQAPQQQIAVPLPAILEDEEVAVDGSPSEAVVAVVPISLLDVEPVRGQTAATDDESAVRNTRGLGGFGKFGGLGLGFKGGFGGFGGFGLHGLGGLHGFGGGFKHIFGKHFG